MQKQIVNYECLMINTRFPNTYCYHNSTGETRLAKPWLQPCKALIPTSIFTQVALPLKYEGNLGQSNFNYKTILP